MTEALTQQDGSPLLRSYTIAFAMRSGSNEICNLLTRNGLGAPSEFFQSLDLDDPGTSISRLDHLRNTVAEHARNGIFGSKMAHDHRARLDAGLARVLRGYRTIDDVLPDHRWVWLLRRDTIAQAISLCRAEYSNIWAISKEEPRQQPVWKFDFFDILSRALRLMVDDLAWRTYFATYNITPYVITYEDFFLTPATQLVRLIDYLGGLPPGREGGMPDVTATLVVQRDALSEECRLRFCDYLNRIGTVDMGAEFGSEFDVWHRFFAERGWRKGSE